MNAAPHQKCGAFFVLSSAGRFPEFRSMSGVEIEFGKQVLLDTARVREVVRQYGAAIIEEMARNIHNMDLIDKGRLLQSLKSSVRTKFDEVDRIEFSYEWYGYIFENGAQNVFGKGVTIEPRHWRSEAIDAKLPEMDQELSDLYALMILEQIQIESARLTM